jgi:hypothetical protein
VSNEPAPTTEKYPPDGYIEVDGRQVPFWKPETLVGKPGVTIEKQTPSPDRYVEASSILIITHTPSPESTTTPKETQSPTKDPSK